MAEAIADSAANEIGKCGFNLLKEHVGYLINCNDNVENMKDRKAQLEARRGDLETLEQIGRFAGGQENKEVHLWLEQANRIAQEANEIVQKTEEKKKWLCCPNLCWCYNIGKKAAQMVEKISEYLDKGKFDKATIAALPLNVMPQDVPSIEGFLTTESALTKVMDALRDEEKKIIGVWGMGGVGKTTLVKHVNNSMQKTSQFNKVIMVIASKDLNLERLQDDIAERLGFSLKDKIGHSRAESLRMRVMQEDKLLIILDDLWQRIELADVGIPRDNKACKILLTTRQEAVCRQMETQSSIKVDALSENESWKLFKEKAGDIVDDPSLHTVAKEVAEECGGLPLAIITLGRALRGVTDHRVWENALSQMKKSAPSDIEGMEDNVYQSIKISYDRLKIELKPAFLFCSLFPEDYDINVEEMIRYWRGEGLIKDEESLEEIMNRGHTWVQQLKSSSLLLDGEQEGHVKLHDIVRDVSISVASREEEGCKSLVRAGVNKLKGLSQEQKWEEYERISLIRSGVEKLPKAMHCPNLLTLLMQENDELKKIPDWLFKGAKTLRVLNLSGTGIRRLPRSLSNLVNLRDLSMSGCSFKTSYDLSPLGRLKQLESLDLSNNYKLRELPIEIGQLVNLKRLDLTDTSSLTTIPCGAISSLSRLEALKMFGSSFNWEERGEIIEEREDDASSSYSSNATLAEVACLTELSCIEISIIPDAHQEEEHPLQLKHWVKLKQFDISVCFSKREHLHTGGDSTFPREGKIFGRKMALFDPKEDLPGWVSMLLPLTTQLLLVDERGLRRFRELGAIFSCLESLRIDECIKMECVFSKNDAPPNLHFLELGFLENLEKMVDEEAGEGSFSATFSSLHNLRELSVYECPRLKTVLLPYSLLQNMENLTEVTVAACHGIEHVFGGPTGDDVLSKLKRLTIKGLENMETIWPSRLVVTYFRNLTHLEIRNCNGLRKSILSSAEMNGGLPNLEKLVVSDCRGVREIISEVVAVANEECLSLLPKLRFLTLSKLPKLERIYGGGTEADAPMLQRDCHSLEEIYVERCHKLKKLQPLQGGANSAPSLKQIWGERVWWEGLDWDGDDTVKSHFQPLFRAFRY